MEVRTKSLEEFEVFAREFARGLRPRDTATLVTLSGNLGAGKTAFTKTVARELGVREIVTSPTFVLEKIYPLSGQAFSNLIHIDAYRLEGGAELAPLNLDQLLLDPTSLIFLEWPEKVADTLPQATHTISIQADGDARTITYV